jgi:SprT protein
MVKFSRPESSSQVLFRFPEDTRWLIQEYFGKYSFHLKITNPRKLRLGSFRAALKGELPIISLNNDLGQYSFLLVFLHELAHLHTWQEHGRRVAPHGKEWKDAYRILSSPLFEKNNIPLLLLPGLQKYFNSSRASFHRDVALQRVLHSLDGNGHLVVLGDIPAKGSFHLSDGKQMIKLERIRTRYKCYCPSNKKYYLVSPAAQIFLTASHY